MTEKNTKWYSMRTPPIYIESQSENTTNFAKSPHVVAMVGIPARGKTCVATKLSRYLNWIGFNSKVFDLEKCISEDKQMVVMNKLEEVCSWLGSGGEVAILDSDNLTIQRRSIVYEVIVKRTGYKLFFIEMICTDNFMTAKMIERTLEEQQKTNKQQQDFKAKILQSEQTYEALKKEKEPYLSYIKVFNSGKKFEIHKQQGHIQGRIIYYVINTKVIPHTMYLTRHGESEFNTQDRIGGDTNLTENGILYAKTLAEFIRNEKVARGLKVWTSWMKRAIQTADYIELPQERWKALVEIDAGACNGMTYEEIKEKLPIEYEGRKKDKLNYRYPGGESYKDVMDRLEPIIMEMEREGDILVITHQGVLRCLLGYFLDKPKDMIPNLETPLHTVFKLTAVSSEMKMEMISLHVPAVQVSSFNRSVVMD